MANEETLFYDEEKIIENEKKAKAFDYLIENLEKTKTQVGRTIIPNFNNSFYFNCEQNPNCTIPNYTIEYKTLPKYQYVIEINGNDSLSNIILAMFD